MAYQYEFLESAHPEEDLPPKSKNPKKSVKKPSPFDKSYPINFGKIQKMNEEGSDVPSTSAPVNTVFIPPVRMPSKANPRTGQSYNAKPFKQIPSTVMIRPPKQPPMSTITNQKIGQPIVVSVSKPTPRLPFSIINTGVAKRVKTDETQSAAHQVDEESDIAMGINNEATAHSKKPNNKDEPITLNMLFEKLQIIENIGMKCLEYHIATKRMVKDLTKDFKTQRAETVAGATTKTTLQLPIRSQTQLEEIENHYTKYQIELRHLFENHVCHKAFDLYRYFCGQLLINTDYYNWSGTKAHNAMDDRVPKNASQLQVFQLLLSVGMEKLNIDHESASHEMVRAITAFHSAVAAREKRRHV